MSDIPQWAIEKALKPFLDETPTAPWTPEAVLAEMDRPHGAKGFAAMVLAYAKLIDDHEPPPVDPVLVVAREMFCEDHKNGEFSVASLTGSCIMKYGAANEEIRAGKHDYNPIVRRYLKALRRGIELGKQP
jgi:hypothetical protein